MKVGSNSNLFFMKENKLVADEAVADIVKMFGKGAIMQFTGEESAEIGISTGCLSLDLALGIGGLPRGKITEIYGPESSGKTTICLQTMANAQADGSYVAIIDVEQSFDPLYAKALGINMDRLLVSQPDNGEQALEIVLHLIQKEAISVVVVDSVSALVPKAELDGNFGSSHMGAQARLMSQAMRKLVSATAKHNVSLIFINQLRDKIGVMFGSPETTSGGKALKFYASVRLDIRRIGAIKEGEEFLGNRTRVKVVKSKVSVPHKQCEFDIVYGKGVDIALDLADLAVKYEVIVRSGAWFTVGEQRFQGKAALVEHLTDKKIFDKLKVQVEKAVVAAHSAKED